MSDITQRQEAINQVLQELWQAVTMLNAHAPVAVVQDLKRKIRAALETRPVIDIRNIPVVEAYTIKDTANNMLYVSYMMHNKTNVEKQFMDAVGFNQMFQYEAVKVYICEAE